MQLVKYDRRRFDVCYHVEMKSTLCRTHFKCIRRDLDSTFALGLSLKNPFKVILNVFASFRHKFRGAHFVYAYEEKYCHRNVPLS